jgi:N-acetylmuramoyl-L-alanine amidase
LARASKQLLYIYKQQEIDQLKKPQLYLLRNAIFGQTGYVFSTPKLHKFSNRRGWKLLKSSPRPPSIVERCNAWFLEELHPTRELGAIGRGVLFSQSPSVPAMLKAQVCTCLAQDSFGVDCRDGDQSNLRMEFYDYVDFVIKISDADRAEIRWNFLDPKDVADASWEEFQQDSALFRASALQFSAQMQVSLASAGQTLQLHSDEGRGPYWGVTLTLPKQLVSRLATDPKLAMDISNSICTATVDVLNKTGPAIPWTIDTESQKVGDEPSFRMYSKPIVFDDERRTLTREFIERAYPKTATNPSLTIRPRAVVVQATESADMDNVFRRMLPAAFAEKKSRGKELNPATHYLVGTSGAVYQLMNDTIISRHAPGLDVNSIGITLVGASKRPAQLEQIRAAKLLIVHLKKNYPTIEYVIASNSTVNFQQTSLWTGPRCPADSAPPAPSEESFSSLMSEVGKSGLGLRSSP